MAPTGTPLTVYKDPADGREYWYTLVVPADAHRLYPCFDQPDVRAVFRFELDLPNDWCSGARTAASSRSRSARTRRTVPRLRRRYSWAELLARVLPRP